MSVYILLTPSDCSYTLHTQNLCHLPNCSCYITEGAPIVAVLQCHERAHQKDSGLFFIPSFMFTWRLEQCFTCENSWEWSSAWLGCYTTPPPWADLSVKDINTHTNWDELSHFLLSPSIHITIFKQLPFWFSPTSDNWLTPTSNLGMDLDDVVVWASFERASNVVSSFTLIVGMSSSCVHSNILWELNLENENALIYTSYNVLTTHKLIKA